MQGFVFMLLWARCIQHSFAEGLPAESTFAIGASQPLQFTGAEFHAYENAWSVHYEPPDETSLLLFFVCRHQCHAGWRTYRVLSCSQLLQAVYDSLWYNAYVASRADMAESLCESMRSAPDTVSRAAGQILLDAAGASLVHLRPPHTIVMFNEQELLDLWMQQAGDELSITIRATQIEPIGEHFGVRHAVHTVRLLNASDRADLLFGTLTLGLRNGCTAIGLSAPDFGSVRTQSVGGRLRCVWECRDDMLREPYNAVPPTREQLNESHPDYAALPIKYACVALPSVWVSTVFGFTVAVPLSADDVGYAQALLDAVDALAASVQAELTAAGVLGRMIFSIKNSPLHSSFAQRLQDIQKAQCAVAGVQDTSCTATSVSNPEYVYRRRLLTVGQAEIEGLFISESPELFSAQNIATLQTQISKAVVENAALLNYDNSSSSLIDIQDFDFAEVVFFATPSSATPSPPSPAASKPLTDYSADVLFFIGLCSLAFFSVVLCMMHRMQMRLKGVY